VEGVPRYFRPWLDGIGGIVKKLAMAKPNGQSRVAALYRYPVKGLSAERLRTVELEVGSAFPKDRAFALENGPSGFDPDTPKWQPKIKFLCLMRNARIAALTTRYDDANGVLTIAKGERTLLEASLSDASDRSAIEHFFQDYMGPEARGNIRVLDAPGHSFSDIAKKVVSIINLESIAGLEQAVGRKIHPLRFRGNVYAEGIPAWSETRLIDRTIEIGSARLRVIKMIQRCAATEVDPETAARDIDVPDALYRLTGEDDCGIYAEVIGAGRMAEGDAIRVID
jgi:uncharacterized protein YcbX